MYSNLFFFFFMALNKYLNSVLGFKTFCLQIYKSIQYNSHDF